MRLLEVLFCGDSIYLCSLAAKLRQNQELRVSTLDENLTTVIHEITIFHPDVVIFETVSNVAAEVKRLCDRRAALLVIVVHPRTDSLEVFIAGRHFSVPLNDLEQVIREALGANRENEEESKT